MNHDAITIEKFINDNDKINLHYSECINEATIKIIRKGKPNIRYKMEYKAEITYDILKELALKFCFVKNPKTEDIIDFIEEKLKGKQNELHAKISESNN